MWLVHEQWHTFYGSGACKHCCAHNTTEDIRYCEVLEGSESPEVCPIWDEFVQRNEIKVYL